jgi:hypothetical protein
MANRPKALAAAAAAACLLCVLALPALAAGVSVPALELVTRGAVSGGVYALQSRGSLDLAVEGGYKFGGSVLLGFTNSPLEPREIPAGIEFRGMSITVRDLASLPLSLSFFVGDNDILCAGDSFTTIFGTRPIMTRWRGFLTFPDGIKTIPTRAYDGIHRIDGTGLRADINAVPGSFLMSLYAYQDSAFVDGLGNLTPGYYSGDARALASLGPVKMEGFLGATYAPASLIGYYRGGILFHATGPGVEFLAQIGVPKYDPGVDPVSINLLYVLFEPRLHLGLFSIVPTFFWHPGYYVQRSTGELGSFDLNLDLYVGDLATTSIQGGIQGALRFDGSASLATVTASPYLSFITPGILWDFKVDARLSLPFGLDNISGIVGIRAEF